MYEDKTYENIKQNILDNTNIDINKDEGSFLNNMNSPVALELEKCYAEFEKLLSIMFLDSSVENFIDRRVSEYGISRKQGTKATGIATFTGNAGTIISKGTLIATNTNLAFETMEIKVIGDTTVDIPIQAVEIGRQFNVQANTIIKLPFSITGVSSVKNNNITSGGTDIETDEELVKRFLLQLQNPSTSGNAAHYKQWALSVNGIGNAKVIPTWNGNGTVKVLIVDSNKSPANSNLIANVSDYIDTVRPIGIDVTVAAPTAKNINITAVLSLDTDSALNDVENLFYNAVNEYLKSIVFTSNTVSYAKIGSILLDTKGVLDYANLNVNGGSANISIENTEVPIIGTIILN